MLISDEFKKIVEIRTVINKKTLAINNVGT